MGVSKKSITAGCGNSPGDSFRAQSDLSTLGKTVTNASFILKGTIKSLLLKQQHTKYK